MLILRGAKQRKVAKTTENAVSSRSHMVVVLRVTAVDGRPGGKDSVRTLTLVDLAGSEPLGSGDR